MSLTPELSIRALARALKLDVRGVSRDVRRGMPRDIEGALQWRLSYVRAQKGTRMPSAQEAHDRVKPPAPKIVGFTSANPAIADVPDEELEAVIKRLRRLERACSAALERHLREGRVAESQALRREHAMIVKSLFDASSKLLKFDEARGKLCTVEIGCEMISQALGPSILMLRQLPAIAQSPEERRRLETALNGVLEEMKRGAEAGSRWKSSINGNGSSERDVGAS